MAISLAAGSISTTHAAPKKKPCETQKCEAKREYQKARKHTPRHPIPIHVVMCESGGDLRAQNPTSSAGGRYQILTSTWAAFLPSDRFIRIAGGNRGPRWSSRLLQDRVALNVLHGQGLGAWECA